MADFVPASTKVRVTRIRNIDTDRLCRRRDFLVANRDSIARNADSRMELRYFARELTSINRELIARR